LKKNGGEMLVTWQNGDLLKVKLNKKAPAFANFTNSADFDVF